MASNPDFVQYIVDQCGGAGNITVRMMMGDWCIYCDGKLFGLISDNGFYVKPTDAGRALLEHRHPAGTDPVDMRPPYQGAKPHFYIEDVDDRDYLSALVKATCAALPEPKPKKKK